MPYNAGDLKWGVPVLGEPSGTITWSADYVDALNFSSSYDAGDFNAALLDAFDTWENVASIDFQMVSSGADVTVGTESLGGAAGTAFFTFDGNPGLSQIFAGEITFNSDLVWAPYGNGGIDFYAVALHEIGHIIGLGHVNDINEIMNPVIYADSLGSGDIMGAQFLYGTDPGDIEPPQDPPTPGGGLSGGSDGGDGGGAIALVMGILAALLALVFGGGAAAGAALAVGRVASSDDDDQNAAADDSHDHAHDLDIPGVTEHLHVAYVAGMPLPCVPFDGEVSACGCYGPCDCLSQAAEPEFLM